MSHPKKQQRLRAGSRKKRGLQLERLEDRVVMTAISEFGLSSNSTPSSIVTGPNGNLWFTEPGTDRIGEISTSGTITEFDLSLGSNPQGITSGPDGNLWFTEYGSDKIGEITTSGTITEFALAGGSSPQGITTGSNGNLWFTENGASKIGEIVPSGVSAGTITEFALAGGSGPFGITSGPNGNLWFTEADANKVGQIVPSGDNAGTITEYSVSNGSLPVSITTGSDGNLWFTESIGNNIGKVTPDGQVTEYSIPLQGSNAGQITSGPSGDLYFTEVNGNNIAEITTSGNFVGQYSVPTSSSQPLGITQGPDNHIWFTESIVSQVGRLDLSPVAVDDSYSASENTPLTVNAANGVLANDTDPENDTLTASRTTDTSHGSVTLNADGSFTYTPDDNYFGTDSFTYMPYDGIIYSDTAATVTIQVDAPPVAVDDSYTTPVGTTLSVNAASGVLANDIDPNGHSMTAAVVSQPSHGTLTLLSTGAFTYIPSPGYDGTVAFTYQDTDSDGITLSGIATVTLLVDTAPVAYDDSYTTDRNTPLVIALASNGVLGNDSAFNGDTPSVAQADTGTLGTAHGSIRLDSDGTFTYTPTPGYTGTDTFSYYDYDGYQDSASPATVTFTVNAPPVAVNDNYELNENGVLNVSASGILANDTGTGSLTAIIFGEPSHGSVTLNSNGSFIYTPSAGYSGTDSFSYKASDGITDSAYGYVYINVDAPPTAINQAYNVTPNTPLTENAANGVLAGNIDTFSTQLYAYIGTNPAHGSLSWGPNDGSFTYTPNAGYNGTDSFTYYDYDGFGYSQGDGTVTLTVDTPPVAVADSYDGNEGLALTVNASNGLLVNDTQAQGESLAAAIVTQPAHGTLTLYADGSFTYIPTGQFYGTDSFTYQDNDGTTNSNIATVSLDVAEDFAPTANNASQLVGEGGITVNAPGLLTGDTDSNGQPLTAVLVSSPAYGGLTFNADGSYVYIPNSSFGTAGGDSFTFRTFDGVLTSTIATVTLNFDGTYYAPVAQPQSYTVDEGSTLSPSAPTGVLNGANDYWNLGLTAIDLTQPTHGSLAFNSDGSFVYTPPADYYGTDSFQFEANNGQTNSSAQTATINVSQVIRAPVAVNDTFTTGEANALTEGAVSGVLANDTDPQGDPLTAILVTNPSHGAIALNANGSFTYTPVAGFYGTDSFTYKDNNGSLNSNIATVTFTVTQVYYAPVAVNDTYTIPNGQTLSISSSGVLANDTDPNSLSLNSQLFGAPSHDSSFTFNNNGSFTYIPTAGFVGTDSFTYKAADGQAISSLATVTITVTNPLTVTGTTDSATVGTVFTGNVGWFTDANPTAPVGNFTATIHWGDNTSSAGTITQPGGVGTAFEIGGTHTYDSSGNLTATIVIADANTNTASATTPIAVAPASPLPPVAVSDSYTVNENAALTQTLLTGVLANDTDPQSDPLSAILVTNPSHGALALNADGSFVYTPTANYYGSDSFTYKDNNGALTGNTATVDLSVSQVQYAPVAVADSYTVAENITLNVPAQTSPLVNDSQQQGDPFYFYPINIHTSQGGLILQYTPGTGAFIYQPATGFTGTDTFQYKSIDSNNDLSSNIVTVTITVTPPIPVAPVAVDDSQIVGEGGVTTVVNGGDVLSNDINNSVPPLTALLVSEPAHGSLSFNSDGTYTYVPNSSFGAAGTDSFTYRAYDGTLLSNVATVTLTFSGPYYPPVAQPLSYTALENGTLTTNPQTGVLAGANDYWNLPLTAINLDDGPSHGSLTLNSDGSFTYTPTVGYSGTDTFQYEANNGFVSSTASVVTLNVSPAVQTPPVAIDQSYTTSEEASLVTTTQNGVLVGDTDFNEQPLTALLVSSPTHGTLNFNADGTFDYTPTDGFYGTDSFTYEANDGTSNSNLATVTFNVTQVELPPVAVNDLYSTAEGSSLSIVAMGGVLANDINYSNHPLSATLVSGTTEGTLHFNSDGSFTYTPDPMFYGTDSFTYTASDGTLTSQTATVLVTVGHVPHPPGVSNSSYSISEGTTLTVNGVGVLSGATDPDALPLTASDITEPSHGTLTLDSNGSFAYTPNAGYYGTDSFTFQASDGEVNSNIGTVTITVAPVGNPPVAVADSYTTTEGTTLTITSAGGVLANDTVSGNDPLTATLVAPPTHGTLTLNSNGSFVYTPMSNFSGTDSFMYQAHDGQMPSNVAVVTVTVKPDQISIKADPVAGDYYGTGQADVAVYLVNQGAFAIRPSNGGPDQIVPFGIAGAGQTIPAPGDYFGTGLTDIAAYLPSQGVFAIRNPAGGPDEIVPFGIAGAGQTIPAPGDYFGTGQTDIAAYLPSIGAFAIRNPAGGPDEIIPFGMAGVGNSIPAPGDYDGSGKTELAVYMPSLGAFAYRPADGGPDKIIQFGAAGAGKSIPMPGDYDGSGKTELAVYMPATATFAYRPANGGPDVLEQFGLAGAGQTLPAAGDYTGVGHDELAAFLPGTATFAIRPGGNQPDTLQQFGIAGLGQTIPVTVIDQALAEMPATTVSALSIDIPDPSSITDAAIFPSVIDSKKKKHQSQ